MRRQSSVDLKATGDGVRSDRRYDLGAALHDMDFVQELTNACRTLGSEPEEIAGETLERLVRLERSGGYRPDWGTAMAYAVGVARRVAQGQARRLRRRPAMVALSESDAVVSVDPALRLVAGEEWSRVVAVVNGMPPQDQEIFWKMQGLAQARDRGDALSPAERVRACRLRKKIRDRLT